MPVIFKPPLIPALINPPIAELPKPFLPSENQRLIDQYDGAVGFGKSIIPSKAQTFDASNLLKMETKDLVQLYRDTPKEELGSILENVMAFVSESADELTDDQINKLVKCFLCFGWVCRILQDPEHSDLSYQEFNSFCLSLPLKCMKALGWQVTPDPFIEGKSFLELGFNSSLQGKDNLCTLHTVNAALSEGQEYSVAQVIELAEQLAAKDRRAPADYFSTATGLSPEFRDLLLTRRNLCVLPALEGVDGDQLAKHLVDIEAEMCLIDSYAVATQFPNGLISRAPHSALIRQDESKQWWLINSMEPSATRVNFNLINIGEFLFTPIKKQPA